MNINFYFVSTKKNYYSFPPLAASLSSIPFAKSFNVSPKQLYEIDFSQDTVNIVGFSYTSLAFLAEFAFLKKAVSYLKTKNVILIAGGAHATAKPEDFFELGFDAVVCGEGELAILEIAKKAEMGVVPKGVFKCEVNSLDDVAPFPVDVSHYKPIEITRGCPFGCFFCQTSYMFSKRQRHRSIDNIIYYLKLAFLNGIKDFRFITPNALAFGTQTNKPNIVALETLFSEIRKVIGKDGRLFFGSFPSEVRPEFVTKEVMEILKSYVDNKKIIIGAQTASERMLKLSHRLHTLEDVENAIEYTLSTGFSVDLDLIVGMPDENENDIIETIKFIDKYLTSDVRFHLHYFMPLCGTPWETKTPTKINDSFTKDFKRLTGMGKIWGVWQAQKTYTKF